MAGEIHEWPRRARATDASTAMARMGTAVITRVRNPRFGVSRCRLPGDPSALSTGAAKSIAGQQLLGPGSLDLYPRPLPA